MEALRRMKPQLQNVSPESIVFRLADRDPLLDALVKHEMASQRSFTTPATGESHGCVARRIVLRIAQGSLSHQQN